jgi:uncharacterized protein (DUF2236 family)
MMARTASQLAQSASVVRRPDLDRAHAYLRETAVSAEEGVFGSDSMIWRMIQPAPVVPMMLLEAGMLEAPHPMIAFGTMGSQAATDFLPRYHRSADAFYDWFCGDLDTALPTARRIFGYHSKVSGTLPEDIGGYQTGQPYQANEQDLLIWVWATTVRPLKEYYELLEGPLTKLERDRYYVECRRFALLFGIDEALLPENWSAFVDYFDEFTSSSVMDVSAEYLSRAGLLNGVIPGGRTQRLLTTWFLSLVVYRLPVLVRAQYPGLPSRRRHRALAALTWRAIPVLWRGLPRGLRESPRWRAACRRVHIEVPPSRLAAWQEAKLPPPYGRSYRDAGLSTHGNSVH